MASMLRCPHCNAPLTLVDGKTPTECPWCKVIIQEQRVGQPAPGSGSSAVPVVLGAVVALTAMGAGAAA